MLIPFKERIKTLLDKELLNHYKTLYSVPYNEVDSCIDFINRFCFTYDPRLSGHKIIPFELYPKQIDFIKWLFTRYQNQEDGCVDKCRDVGATWCFIAFSIFLLLFRNNVSIAFFTYKASECHTIGKMGTLFEKAVFIIDNLPNMYKQSVETKLMLITNYETKSVIVGASGDNPLRGDRQTIIFKDESAFYEQAESIEAAMSKSSDCKIDISTHAGTATLFYQKIVSGELPIFTFDWWENPRHTQEWFESERKKYYASGLIHIFRREIERNPLASVENILIPAEWTHLAKVCNVGIIGKRIASLDVADEGTDTNALCIMNGNTLLHLEEWSSPDPNETARKAFYRAIEFDCDEFRYDNIGVGTGIKAGLNVILDELRKDELNNKKALSIRIIGWAASGKVIRPDDYDFDEKRPNKDFFENAKSQAYYKIRDEFLQTYHYMNKEQHDATKLIDFSQMIDHPLFNKFMSELSQPLQKLTASGKIIIDKKAKSKSPNIAEAYMIGRAEVNLNLSIWDV
jgi:hypothetical protein